MAYSLSQLAALAGVSPRTVRFYVAQGLLRGPEAAGPATRYEEGHLARLRLIRRLQSQHLPLAEIRRRLEGLSDEQVVELLGSALPVEPAESALDYVRALLDQSRQAPAEQVAAAMPRAARAPASPPRLAFPAGPSAAASAPSPQAAESTSPAAQRSQWERVSLGPDVELHVRRPLSRHQNKRVERLVAIARELLEEETS